MFRDEAKIQVEAGKGGDGLVSFRREKYVPEGGPDGGDGGRGGSIIMVASAREHSLLRIGRQFRYAAQSGRPGMTKKRAGRSGEDIVLEVPVGTLVYDAERGNLLRDLAREGQRLEVVRGGKGGRGNVHFASSIRQVPYDSTPGQEGEERRLRLELKLFAEVGLLGFPNAGKSTFLSAVTAARPKVANYPFTTLEPQVGIAQVGDYDTLVLADLPGLIEGASEGIGLGHRFLKHVERCGVLLHLVDVSSGADRDPAEAVRALEGELERFSPELFQKPRLVVATKVEDPAAEETAKALASELGVDVLPISSHRHDGLAKLLERAHRLCRSEPAEGLEGFSF